MAGLSDADVGLGPPGGGFSDADVGLEPAATSPPPSMSWSDVGSQAMQNLPASVGRVASDIVQPFMHPIQTAEDIGTLGKGALQKAGVMGGTEAIPAADAFGRYFADRYGSMEGFKKAVATDPAGVAADLSVLFSGGETALARLPGRVGRLATLAPATEDLFNAAEQGYRNMHGFGVELHPHVMDNVATNIETELTTQGYRDYLAPKTFRAVDELRNPSGKYTTTQDVEAVRRALGKAGGDPAERDAARRAVMQIDTALANLTPADAAINPHYADRVAQEAVAARGNYAAAKRAETLDDLTQEAERQAASTGSGANIDNATRQRIKMLLKNKKQLRGFSDAEKAQMDQIVRGTFTGNAARLLGKLAPSGVVSGALSAGAGFAAHGPIGAVALPATGLLAKRIADRATANRLNALSEQVRLRSPLGAMAPSVPAPAPRTRLVVTPTWASRQIGRINEQEQP